MDRRLDKTGPDASTLWLAIGLGGFAVFASFFLAIYFSTSSTAQQTAAVEAQTIETVAGPSD